MVITSLVTIVKLETPYEIVVGNPADVKNFKIDFCDKEPCDILEKQEYPFEMTLIMRKFLITNNYNKFLEIK